MDVYNFINLISFYNMGANKYGSDWGTIDENPVDNSTTDDSIEPSIEDFNEPITPPTGFWGWIRKILNF